MSYLPGLSGHQFFDSDGQLSNAHSGGMISGHGECGGASGQSNLPDASRPVFIQHRIWIIQKDAIPSSGTSALTATMDAKSTSNFKTRPFLYSQPEASLVFRLRGPRGKQRSGGDRCRRTPNANSMGLAKKLMMRAAIKVDKLI